MEAKLKDKPKFETSDSPNQEPNDSQQIDELLKQNEESTPSETDDEDEMDESGMCTIACDDGQELEDRQRRPKSKSVVSQIHECAYRLKMNVEFEVVKETGEPVSILS
jgi:uncharacterized FlaG/YvyC family protein